MPQPENERDPDGFVAVEDMQKGWETRLIDASRQTVRAEALLAARTRQRDEARADVARLTEQVEDLQRELTALREGDTAPAEGG